MIGEFNTGVFFFFLINLAGGSMTWVVQEVGMRFLWGYLGLFVLNVFWMFAVDFLRAKLWFGKREDELNQWLSEENATHYQKKWLWWSACSYGMGVVLNFEKKLQEPLLVWNYEKQCGSGEKVRIEKIIRLLNGTEDDN
jgi:hypothetical protein